MLLADVKDRVTVIWEGFNDTETAYAEMRELYWIVLIAIANGQCEDASPREFAAAVIELEPLAAETFGSVEYGAELREHIAGKIPQWLEWKYAAAPPAATKASKETPKSGAKEPPRKKQKGG